MKNTLILTPRKPRNPFVAAAAMRRAGRHHKGGGALRQQAERALRHELKQAHPPTR